MKLLGIAPSPLNSINIYSRFSCLFLTFLHLILTVLTFLHLIIPSLLGTCSSMCSYYHFVVQEDTRMDTTRKTEAWRPKCSWKDNVAEAMKQWVFDEEIRLAWKLGAEKQQL